MVSDVMISEEPTIKLIAYLQGEGNVGPEEVSAYGAIGCFDEISSADILNYNSSKPKEKREALKEEVFKQSFGRGHGAVADQSYFTLSIENLTRAATLQLCLPEYLSHLQQSFRRATADRGFYLPAEIRDSKLGQKTAGVLSDTFEMYEDIVIKYEPNDKKILEDARFVLPLSSKTNIQTSGDARELVHLFSMNNQGEVPSYVKSITEHVKNVVEKLAPKLIKERETNYETLGFYPSAQLYSSTNPAINKLIENYENPTKPVLLSYTQNIDDFITEEIMEKAIKERDEACLSALKHVHFEFLVPMSLVCYHQATRQRTLNHSIESVYDSAERNNFVIPPKIKKLDEAEEYAEQHDTIMDIYRELIDEGIPRSEAIGVVPHSLQIYDMIHVNGWNAIYSIGKRTCTEAQWEIRNIAKEMADQIKEVNPIIGKYSEPQCITLGKCPEAKSCGKFKN